MAAVHLNMQPASVYPAFRSKPSAVLKQLSPAEMATMRSKMNHLHFSSQQMKREAATQVNSANGSVFVSPFTHLSPLAAAIVGYGSLVINTVSEWDHRDFNSNATQVVAIAAWTVTAIQVGIVYWRHNHQQTLAKDRTEKLVKLHAICSSLDFLVESHKQAEECLKEIPPAQLVLAFANFEASLKKNRDAGDVPNDLADAWGEVSKIIHLPPDDPGHNQLPDLIRTTMLPMISNYLDDYWNELIELGYVPPNPEEMPLLGGNG